MYSASEHYRYYCHWLRLAKRQICQFIVSVFVLLEGERHILGSWFCASFSTYVHKYPTRYNNGVLFYYKITLRVSGTLRAHQQEYINFEGVNPVVFILTFRNPASYIKDGHTATFNTPHFLYFFNKYTY
jgi:hypothetical protein